MSKFEARNSKHGDVKRYVSCFGLLVSDLSTGLAGLAAALVSPLSPPHQFPPDAAAAVVALLL